MQFDEGQWVQIQQRGQFDNPVDYFSRSIEEYVNGFGDLSKEFWLGLDKISRMTSGGAQLRIELETFEVGTFRFLENHSNYSFLTSRVIRFMQSTQALS